MAAAAALDALPFSAAGAGVFTSGGAPLASLAASAATMLSGSGAGLAAAVFGDATAVAHGRSKICTRPPSTLTTATAGGAAPTGADFRFTSGNAW